MRRVILAAAVLAVLALSVQPALAHVEVSPETAVRGEPAKLTFSVPNEEDTAKTTQVEIFLPDTVAPATVTGSGPNGWSAAVNATAPASVRFTGGTISGTDEVEFVLKVSQMPERGTDHLVFKTLQTYDNGD